VTSRLKKKFEKKNLNPRQILIFLKITRYARLGLIMPDLA
jgi:hypothetical protein